MRAQAARSLASRSATELARKRATEQKKENARLADRTRKTLKVDLPRHMKKVLAQILSASREGEHSTDYVFSTEDDPIGASLASEMRKRLLALGYDVSQSHEEGYEDMGDSAAPCRIHFSRITLDISWER
jgi:hypothetical protein